MTPSEEKIEQYQPQIGADIAHKFESIISKAIQDLSVSLENNFMDNESKIDYSTHVFAKALDDLSDFLENPNVKMVN